MKKGTVTKELIVENAAGLFNTIGYHRTSMSDLMQATGLEKGGIYNHFKSKDELAIAAFEYAVKVFGKRIQERVTKEKSPLKKLYALIDGFQANVEDPPLEGGCPLLNCAVENDQSNDALKEKAREAVDSLTRFVEGLVIDAQAAKEIRKKFSPKQVATFIISSIEGGIMLSRLYEDKRRMGMVADSIREYLSDLEK
jgi:TetR/AcrR family transcriptional repressor of nem operon